MKVRVKSEAEMFLTSVTYIGYRTIKMLLNEYGSYEEIFKSCAGKIEKFPAIQSCQKEELIRARKNWNYQRYIENLDKNHISLVTIDDERYPCKLRNISNPPFRLFVCGELPDEEKATVSIIGARNCSEYGRFCGKYFAEGLAKKGVQIVSGLASGIDGIAQNSAINAEGKSFGILGSGPDICYPKSNWQLFEMLKDNGGVISEFPPGTKPLARHFPMRNRIISALSDIVLVVEAKERSGTSITVNMALEQGKDIFAVPGRISDRLSDGCNKLICDGAGMARDVNDILDALSISQGHSYEISAYGKIEKIKDAVSDIEYSILQIIIDGDKSVQELYMQMIEKYSDLSIQELKVHLLNLECEGYIVNELGVITSKM